MLPEGDEDLVTAAVAARLLGLRVQTVHHHLSRVGAPVPVGVLGNARVWRWGVLRDFLLARRVPARGHGRGKPRGGR